MGGSAPEPENMKKKALPQAPRRKKSRAMVAPQAPLSPNLAKWAALQVLQNQRRTKNAELVVWKCHQELWISGAKIIFILFD